MPGSLVTMLLGVTASAPSSGSGSADAILQRCEDFLLTNHGLLKGCYVITKSLGVLHCNPLACVIVCLVVCCWLLAVRCCSQIINNVNTGLLLDRGPSVLIGLSTYVAGNRITIETERKKMTSQCQDFKYIRSTYE